MLLLTMLALAAAPAPAARCTGGKVPLGAQCCWPDQGWSPSKKACVGIPSCPAGLVADGEECVEPCEAGKTRSLDTAGKCCWPAQGWSASRQQCIGVPTCPAGLQADGETCVPACAPGMAVSVDTAGHCCWPGQAWSSSRNRCIGIPTCASGLRAEGEQCVAAPIEAAPAPPPVFDAPPPMPAAEAPAIAATPDAGVPIVATPPAPVAPPSAAPVAVIEPPSTARVHNPPAYFFISAGAFLLGYLPGVILPAAYGDYNRNTTRVSPIPFAGPLLMRDTLSDTQLEDGGWGALTIVGTILQWGGFAGMVIGAIDWIVGKPPPKPKRRVTAELDWWVSPTAAGARVRW